MQLYKSGQTGIDQTPTMGTVRAKQRRGQRNRQDGQGRRQTERITRKQAGSERQAANNQERESTVQVKHGKTN